MDLNKLQKFDNETQENFEKRLESIRLLGDKWLLAQHVPKLSEKRYA